jgi:hypothetical protein
MLSLFREDRIDPPYSLRRTSREIPLSDIRVWDTRLVKSFNDA